VLPGRDLDALVAEKVMGWKWNDESAWLGDSKWSRTHGDPWNFLPHYSTDIAAAWDIRDKVAAGIFSTRHFFSEECQRLVSDQAGVQLLIHHSEVILRIQPHQICLAALRAVGYQPA
jgi:hypothetical protein